MTIKAKKIFLFVGILTSVISACLGVETQRTNHLGWALLFAGTVFISVGAITLGRLFLQDTGQRQLRDRSLWLPTFGVLVISLVTPLEYLYMTPVLARNDHFQDIGLILFAGGLCFYLLMFSSQEARSNTDKPTKLQSPRLCTRITQWICRPTFASLTLFTLGLSIGYSSLIGLLMFFFMVLPGLVYRMILEDQKLKMIE